MCYIYIYIYKYITPIHSSPTAHTRHNVHCSYGNTDENIKSSSDNVCGIRLIPSLDTHNRAHRRVWEPTKLCNYKTVTPSARAPPPLGPLVDHPYAIVMPPRPSPNELINFRLPGYPVTTSFRLKSTLYPHTHTHIRAWIRGGAFRRPQHLHRIGSVASL